MPYLGDSVRYGNSFNFGYLECIHSNSGYRKPFDSFRNLSGCRGNPASADLNMVRILLVGEYPGSAGSVILISSIYCKR